MKASSLLKIFLAISFSAGHLKAEEHPKEVKIESGILQAEEEAVTEGHLIINEKKIPYTAVAGTYQFKDENGQAKARFFYIAYTRSDVENKALRPIAFCFNGGPGASSVWMHLGLLGPKKVVLKDGVDYQPPYEYADNPYSLLDEADLVFIDPISTGYSRTNQGVDAKQFHSLQEDIKSIGEFIRIFITRNSRWESPKYLIGASYGTMRAVELASYLFDKFNMATNGILLISSILNFQTIDVNDCNNDLPFVLYLPSYTATAWSHQRLTPSLQADLGKALKEARDYAYNEYSLALLKGDRLSPEERKEVAQKLAYFTGLQPQLIERMNLRVKSTEFIQELLKDQGNVIGRFDTRVVGKAIHSMSNSMEYDPSMDAIFSAFTATFNQYVRNELKWVKDDEYKVLANVMPWNYGKDNCFFSAIPTLREVLLRLPRFSVFVANGYFDLATPFLGTDFSFNHLNVGAASERIKINYYPGGHMMYTSNPSLEKLSRDIHSFIGQID